MDGSTECNGLDRIYRERKMWKDCWFVSCNKVLLSSIVFRAGLERKYIAAAALGGGGGGGGGGGVNVYGCCCCSGVNVDGCCCCCSVVSM